MKRKHFDAEHEAFADSFRALSTRKSSRIIWSGRKTHHSPGDLPAAGRNGFLGMAVPEEFGGGGVDDFRFNQALDEQVALAGVTGAGLGITLHNDTCLPYFLSYANDEQRQRWLPASSPAS